MPRGAYYLVFVASGFAGLIYESIWTHYLKLFLGHAAYAQSLVLGAKLALASLLIVPQSLLLGMTFPLMSAGLARAQPRGAGESVAMLYFTNSLGAALGVLASGFVM